jgi:cellulose synthase/poly-beta-1,6-N-acetylglucosamine synthase-like glycosyltransferase
MFPSRARSYAVVTPARNEAANLRRLASSLAEQTILPDVWIIVDDGSTDETPAVVGALAAEHQWVRPLRSEGAAPPAAYGRRVAKEAAAFQVGVKALEQSPDVVVKVDADVTVPADFFERLLHEFESDPSLGVASGLCYEQEGRTWRPRHATGSNPRGATRAYRRECLREVLPLEQRLGWDGIDSAKACARGWTARNLNELPFFHHRKTGARDRTLSTWAASGETLYYMGYRPSYVVAMALYRSVKDLRKVAVLWGYAAAAARRQPQCPDSAMREYVRDQQRLRVMPIRAREALGRTAAT